MKPSQVGPEDVWEVDYPTKYLTYIFVGWTGSYVAPLIFYIMGLNVAT